MASDIYEENAIEKLATNESLEVLWGALHSALEADLSGQGWPEGSLKQLEEASEAMDEIVTKAERLNRGDTSN